MVATNIRVLLAFWLLLGLASAENATAEEPNPYRPSVPVKKVLAEDPELAALLKVDSLARYVNRMDNKVKSTLRIATYTVNFKRVAMACYYEGCEEAHHLKRQLEAYFLAEGTLRSTYFVASFVRPGSATKTGGWGWWSRITGDVSSCDAQFALKKSTNTLPIFYVNSVRGAKAYPDGLGLEFGTEVGGDAQSAAVQGSAQARDQLILAALVAELKDYAEAQDLRMDVFSELLVSGLGKSYESFVETSTEERINLYYADLCAVPEPTVLPLPEETRLIFIFGGSGAFLVCADVLLLAVRWALRRYRRAQGKGSDKDGQRLSTGDRESMAAETERVEA